MSNRHTKRCSTSLDLGKMQINTIMRYHFTPTGRTLIKNCIYIYSSKCWQGFGATETVIHY